MDLGIRAVVLIVLTVVPLGCAQTVPLQRLRRQTSTAKPALKVTDYHVRCSVVSRYALTTVESTVWNQLHITKEAAFEVDLTPSAFISNFTITSNGKVYVSEVKMRNAARKIYDAAKKQGKTAALVATKEREIEKFRVAVNVPPGARVSFSLSYEELLSRRLGRYEITLGLRPGQLVQNLSLDVSIAERTGISFVRALPLRTSRLLTNNVQDAEPPPSTQVKQNLNCAHVRYVPSMQQQKNISPRGLNADFIIQYDVELKDPMGDIQVDDGYFVHYFAPRGLPVVPKDVIFVIDISGSMIGTKIKQTKAAMMTILSDLREGDYFNLITFSDKVHTWRKGRTVRATRQNVREAKEFVRNIIADGWTNINAALLSAARLMNPTSPSPSATDHVHSSHRVPMIIFLTDGEATIGVTEPDVILHNAQNALGLASLFGLAFGDDADFPLLRRLAMENRGVARMVYEDEDAAIQLKGFYDEVASPLLSDIQLSYLDDQAYDVTRTLFPNYFQGSELVVTGRLKPGVQDLKVTLTASDSKQKVKVENELPLAQALVNATASSPGCAQALDGVPSFVHRLWAYFTIKELLVAKTNTTDSVIQRLLVDKATNLSLKYNFVTPVTSLVVIKPDIDEPEPTSSAITTTTRKPTAGTTPGSANVTNQTSHSAIEIKDSSSATKQNKPTVSKSVRPHPAPSGLHTTGRPPNTSLSNLSLKKTTTVPPNTTPAPSSSKPSSSPPNTIKTTATSGGVRNTLKTSKTQTTSSSQLVKTTTLATLIKTAPTVIKDSSLTDIKNTTTSRLTTLQTLHTTTASTTDTTTDVELQVATLLAPSFMPMLEMTDAPKLWEASRVLDVSSVIHIQEKDIDLVKDYNAASDYDYDYNIHYDSYSDAGEAGDLDNSASLSSVRVFSSSVDGDPHFVVQLPKMHHNLCFTIDGRADDVIRLLEDPEKGIIVNGHLMLAPSKEGMENRIRTFFDRITVVDASAGFMITLTMDSVVVEITGEGLKMLPTNQQGSFERQGLRITVDEHHSCWIDLGMDVQFLVLFHRYSHPRYFQMEHLGFYISNGKGLSQLSHGLLGQFLHTRIEVIMVTDQAGFHHAQTNNNSSLAMGLLKKGDEHFPVTLQDKNLKDSSRKRHQALCWVVPKVDVERLLGRSYQSYVVNH